MHPYFSSGLASVCFALVIVGIWHLRRSHRKWEYRKSDYAWVFLQGGVFYVMVVLLIEHFYYGVKYAELVARDFGGPQISIAFFGTLFEAGKSIWDHWHGHGHEL